MKEEKFRKIDYPRGVYYIKPVGNSMFLLLDLSKQDSHYILKETVVPLRSEDSRLKQDEKFIFPSGRSKSKYENLIRIYNYYGYEKFNHVKNILNEEELNRYLLDVYNIELIKLKMPAYSEKLKNNLSSDDIVMIQDRYYDKRCDGITQYSMMFFEVLRKLINVKEIKSVLWKESKSGFLVEMRWRNKVILLTGLNAGYGGEGPKGLRYVLEKVGFGDLSNKALSEKEGKLVK